jgi:subtilisin family serine protease
VAADAPDHVPGRILVSPRKTADARTLERTFSLHRAVVRKDLPDLGVKVLDVPEENSGAIMASLQQTGLFAYVERDYYAHTAATVPNDPAYVNQWHLPQISAPQAWSITTGSSSVVVAVIDSGVDSTHPDLTAKILPGWSFVNNNSVTMDVMGHGTAVAGTVAAISNNGAGVAGVSWGSMIMPLVVVDSTDYASYSNIAAAIQYAADHGVRVMNISIGGSSASSTLQTAVNYAWGKGAIIFASAMNSSTNAPYYPAACTNVVAVAATDNNNNLASFSDYGSWITISAPGTNILTTNDGGGYGYWYGTSFSSPITAGVAALILSVNPALTNAAVVNLLEQNADNIGSSNYFGYGLVDAYKAVSAAQLTLTPVTLSVTPSTASVTAGQTQQFTAVLGGTTGTPTWSLNPTVGSISQTGLYTAPATVNATQTVTIAASVAGLTKTATLTVSPLSTQSTFTPIRVNAGGAAYVDAQGQTWSADAGYSSGYPWNVTNAISGTTAQALYQTCRYGPAFSYGFAVPNGTYTVTVKFAEVSRTAVGQRVFNVALNGSTVLANFDVFAAAGGEYAAVDKSFTVNVTAGQVNVAFTAGNDWPIVSGIQIVPGSSGTGTSGFTPILVNSGGTAYVDSLGQSWSGDTGYTDGYTWSISNAISGTTSQAVYQTCRYGPTVDYRFTVPNGTYTVTLKFAEVSRTAPGQRLFNVFVNGTQVLANFDIFAAAGGEYIAVDKAFAVNATNGSISIQLTTATDWPMINGIQIVAGGTSGAVSSVVPSVHRGPGEQNGGPVRAR